MPVHTSEDQLAAERIVGNPVTPYLGGFAHWLGEQGYHPSTMRAKLRLLEELGGWLAGRRSPVTAFAEGLAETFLTECQKEGRPVRSHQTTLRQFLGGPARKRGSGCSAFSAACGPPTNLELEELGAPLIADFLEHLEKARGNGTRTRNARLANMGVKGATPTPLRVVHGERGESGEKQTAPD